MRRSTLSLRFATSTTIAAVSAAVVLGALPAAAAPAATGHQAAPVPAQSPLPATPLPSDQEVEEAPVTVLQLTDAAGRTTQIAEAGLEGLDEDGPHAPAPLAIQGASAGMSAPAGLDRMMGVAAATPAETSPEDVVILSQPLHTDEFFVAGVTWSGEEALPEGVQVFLRVMEEDSWTPWQLVEGESLEKDEEDITGAEAQLGGGTAPFVAGGATAVQVQVAAQTAHAVPADLALTLVPAKANDERRIVAEAPDGVVADDGEAAELPAPEQATRSILDEGRNDLKDAAQNSEQAQQPVAGGAAGGTLGSSAPALSATQLQAALPAETTPASVARPAIISRSSWGANASYMTWTPRRANITAAVVHHTAGSNNYTAAQSASVVRGIYYYHAVTRGWGDVGYNFLFDKYGRIYEGRAGSLTAPAGTMVTGAHASSYNTGTVGLSAMGDYSSAWAPQSILDNMARVTAWQFSGAGIDARSRSGIIAPGTNFTARGTNLPRIFGHRDVANVTRTTCPGPNIANRLGTMRATVSDMTRAGTIAPPTTPQGPSTPAPTPAPAEPTWYLNNNFDNASDLQFQFGRVTDERLVGDWDGDKRDSVGVRRGNEFRLLNAHRGGEPDHRFTFGRADDDVFIGDWNGNGKDTFAVRRGNVIHIINNLTGGEADRSFTYGRPGDELLVGDWNGNGKDTFAVRRGTAFHIRNDLVSGPAQELAYYGRPTDAAIVGDWNGDGKDTIGVIRNGTDFYLRNVIAGGEADITVTYGRATDEVLVGDWDGDRKDTLGLRRLVP